LVGNVRQIHVHIVVLNDVELKILQHSFLFYSVAPNLLLIHYPFDTLGCS
jgi:hypothetical protein